MMVKYFNLFTNLMVIFAMFAILTCAGSGSSRFQTLPEVKLDRTPYYAGVFGNQVNQVGHFPIFKDETLLDPQIDKQVMQIFEAVQEKMNEHLDSLGVSVPLDLIELSIENEPYLYVGNVDNLNYQGKMYFEEKDDTFMGLFTREPSPAWKAELLEISKEKNLSNFLFFTFGISEYLPRSKNIFHHMEVELGTGYSKSISWTIGEDDPIAVLHIKGMLLDSNGKILRAGAEGFIGQPPSLKEFLEDMESYIEGDYTEHIFSEENLKAILNKQRRDLPGTPYLWEAAVQNLIAQLLGKKDLLIW